MKCKFIFKFECEDEKEASAIAEWIQVSVLKAKEVNPQTHAYWDSDVYKKVDIPQMYVLLTDDQE